jgi:hypothetical protein
MEDKRRIKAEKIKVGEIERKDDVEVWKESGRWRNS